MHFLAAALVMTGTSIVGTEADKELITSYSKKMWTAFQCDQYVSIESSIKSDESLFDIGYGAGLVAFHFVDKNEIRIGQLIHEELLPVPVLLRAHPRPSNDFAIGRIYEAASDKAFNKVTDGIPEREPDRIEKMQEKAKLLFDAENCNLLRSDHPTSPHLPY
jgi:hypothetical protein